MKSRTYGLLLATTCSIVLMGFAYPALSPALKRGSSPCNSCSQSPSTSTDSWLKLTAGAVYRFQDLALDPGTNPAWETGYGSISSSGEYTSPSYMPPGGLDFIRYTRSDGSSAYVTLRIIPNPNLANSGYPRYLRANSTVLASGPSYVEYAYELVGGPTQSVITTGHLSDLIQNENVPVLAVGDVYEAPIAVTDCVDIVAVATTPAETDLAVPASTIKSTSEVNDLVVTAPAAGATPIALEKPKKCKPTPALPWPPGDSHACNNPGAIHRVEGPWGPMKKTGTRTLNGNIKVDSDVEASIHDKFGIHVTINVDIPITRTIITWTQTRRKDKYKCSNGVWTYVGTETYSRDAQGEFTIPAWVAFIDNYPDSGNPRAPWGGEHL